jgi:hypothetical protein
MLLSVVPSGRRVDRISSVSYLLIGHLPIGMFPTGLFCLSNRPARRIGVAR